MNQLDHWKLGSVVLKGVVSFRSFASAGADKSFAGAKLFLFKLLKETILNLTYCAVEHSQLS